MSLHPTSSLLRKATLKDLSSLVKLENEVFNYDQLKRSSFRKFILSSNDLWVIERDKEILAYILILKRKGSLKTRIYSLAVSPLCRGQGLGKSLLTHALHSLKGYHSSRLEVKVDNVGAIQLYESLGFKQIRRIKGFYSDGQDAFVFEKTL